MDIFSTIRIATVVGLSAIKIIGAVLKVKEAKECGLINPVFYRRPNNNQPYNDYQQMYSSPIPVAPAPQPQPIPVSDPYQNSRRNCYYNPSQQMVDNNPYVAPVQPAPMPMLEPVQEQASSMSRRQMGYSMPARPVYPKYEYPATYPTHAGSCGGELMERNDGSYWRSYYNSRKVNYPPPYYYNQPRNYGQQGWYQPRSNSQELQWADRSLGSMGVVNTPTTTQQPVKKWTPMFNWNNPILCKTPQQWQQNGIVAMFYTEDGQPLFGPSPMVSSA